MPVITYTTDTGETATLTITVGEDNTDTANDAISVAEDTVASGNVLSNDESDNTEVVSFTLDGDNTVYSPDAAITVEGGSLLINTDGSYSFTPASDWNGVLPVITYTTDTGETATLTITVGEDNTDTANDAISVAEDTVASGNVLSNDESDNTEVVSFTLDGDNTVYSPDAAITVEGGSLVINSNGSYSFTPASDWNGVLPVITYTTDTGETATLTITVGEDNTDTANDAISVAEDTVASGNVLSNDESDNTEVVSFTLDGDNTVYSPDAAITVEGGSLVINSNGSYSFTPASDWNGVLPVITYTTTGETATLTITVGEDTGETATLTITVGEDNTDTANDAISVAEDTVASGNVLSNDESDNTEVVSFTLDGDNTVYSPDAAITVEGGSLLINTDGSYSFTPASDWNGVLPVITYTTDTGETATLTITVGEDNTDTANDAISVAEDTVASGNVLSNDESDNTEVVSFTLDGDNTVYSPDAAITVEGGSLLINTDGSYSFTPASDWNGVLPVITYTTDTGETATLTITVGEDNTDTANDAISVAEDTVASGNVLSNDESDNTEVVSFTLDGDNTVYSPDAAITVEGGSLVINSNGSYSFTPASDWNGVLPVITYTTDTGETATLTITVGEDNTDTANDAISVAEDTVASGNVLSNDESDNTEVVSFTLDGDNTVYSPDAAITVEGGSLLINTDGSYSFTPASDWNGVLPVITYTTDTGETATLTITVGEDNTDTANDAISVAEDTVASGNVLDPMMKVITPKW